MLFWLKGVYMIRLQIQRLQTQVVYSIFFNDHALKTNIFTNVINLMKKIFNLFQPTTRVSRSLWPEELRGKAAGSAHRSALFSEKKERKCISILHELIRDNEIKCFFFPWKKNGFQCWIGLQLIERSMIMGE